MISKRGNRPRALVTGATAGIGRAIATALACSNYHTVALGRRMDRLSDWEKILREEGASVEVRAVDLRSESERQEFFRGIGGDGDFSVLVNNAGLAKGVDIASEAALADWDEMIETNITALFHMTRHALPGLVRTRGHIINIGSVAGRWTYRGGAVYCATKAAVAQFSEGLRHDLAGTGVRVTNISPGMVETEFSQVRLGDLRKAKEIYEGMTPLTADDIAECVCWCLERPPHVNIQELVVFPMDQAGVGHVHRSQKLPSKDTGDESSE